MAVSDQEIMDVLAQRRGISVQNFGASLAVPTDGLKGFHVQYVSWPESCTRLSVTSSSSLNSVWMMEYSPPTMKLGVTL